MKEDPCYKDHFLSDSPDKFDICFMKCSEAANKKMYPLGLLGSREVYLLMFKPVNLYFRKHVDYSNLADLLLLVEFQEYTHVTVTLIMPNHYMGFLDLPALGTLTALLE